MSAHEDICPWWMGYFLINPLRYLLQDPKKILSPYLASGMTVLEPGPGMGYFTLELARQVGVCGRVIVVDVQEKMLSTLRKRAEKAGVSAVIETRLVGPNGMGLDDLASKVDFTLAFAMVHEVPDADAFLGEIARAMKPGGKLLIAEPGNHVSEESFAVTISKAEKAGFRLVDRPVIRWSLTALLERK